MLYNLFQRLGKRKYFLTLLFLFLFFWGGERSEEEQQNFDFIPDKKIQKRENYRLISHELICKNP